MTEAEVVYQYFEVVEGNWTLLQWWGGVSIGLMAVAFFSGKKINLPLLLTLLAVYSMFSLMIVEILTNAARLADGLTDSLSELGSLSAAGRALLEIRAGTNIRLYAPVVIGITYLGTICYAVFAYWTARRSR